MSQKLLLIVGAPRSGTTLLNAMIGCHSEVAMLNEDFGHAVFNLVSKPVVGNKLCIPNQIELKERGSYVRRQLQKKNLRQFSPQADLSISDYLDRGARIVATVRHPDKVVSSIMSRGKRSSKVATYRWVRAIQIVDELYEKHPDSVLILAYPFLVSEPETTMRRVCDFVGISYESGMLEGYAHTPIYANQKIDSSKADELTLPVSTEMQSEHSGAIEKYQRLLSVASTRAESGHV